MQTPGVESNRFQASRLSQVENNRGSFLFRHSPDSRRGRQAREQTRVARIMDKVLLAVEIVCALIVGWIAVQYIYTVYFDTTPHRLTPAVVPGIRSMVSATPTLTLTATVPDRPTPTRFVEVLPPETGGPGDAATGGDPTATPIGQAPTSTSTPTPSPTSTVSPESLLPAHIRIPVMFLDSAVNEVKINMGQWEVSPMDVGHHEGTANPGEIGNMVLAGHRDINSALFRDLDRLKPGDKVYVSNSLGEYLYIVRESMVVTPDHVEVMEPTDDRRLTLITCTPIGIDTQRLIVIATLDQGGSNGVLSFEF